MKFRCLIPMFDSTNCQAYELNKVYDLDDKTMKRFEEVNCLKRFVPVVEFQPGKKKA